ncbi:MAG: hypothetical protein ABI067_07450 [Leifsonia sp.]
MATVCISVLITIACVFAIPAIVIALGRRNQRRHPSDPIVDAPSTRQQGGALLTVRNRRWQSILIQVVGITIVAVGALLVISALATATDSSAGMGVAGVFATFGGVAFVFLDYLRSRRPDLPIPDASWPVL